jgi:phosphoglucosamine mutase
VNVAVKKQSKALSSPAVDRALKQAESALAGGGRVLLRPSGTEPVIRVMVEGRDASQVRHWANTIAAAVRRAA